jgi:leader peptidase (prepilin peptidase) / N-methyltransferase
MSSSIDALVFSGFLFLLCILCGAITLIDFRRGIIPDALNLAVAVTGVMKAVLAGDAMAGGVAILDAIVIGMICWLLRRLYFTWRKIQGLGLGDVKFLAGAGTWVGVPGMPMLILVAAVSALIAAGGLQLAGHSLTRQSSLPFGPFLAVGLLSTVAAQYWFGVL